MCFCFQNSTLFFSDEQFLVSLSKVSTSFVCFPLHSDYLDNGNNKMAIQQADKLLKKHKDLHCAKVGDLDPIFLLFYLLSLELLLLNSTAEF